MFQFEPEISEIHVTSAFVNSDPDEQQHNECGITASAVAILIIYDALIITPLMISYENSLLYSIVTTVIAIVWTFLIIVNAIVVTFLRCGFQFFLLFLTIRVIYSYISIFTYIVLFCLTPQWHEEKNLYFVLIVYCLIIVGTVFKFMIDVCKN
jgi:hypothetical protein